MRLINRTLVEGEGIFILLRRSIFWANTGTVQHPESYFSNRRIIIDMVFDDAGGYFSIQLLEGQSRQKIAYRGEVSFKMALSRFRQYERLYERKGWAKE